LELVSNFNVFEKEKRENLSCSRLHLFDKKIQYNCEILLQFRRTAFYLNIFKNVIYSSEFAASLLQSSVSHDPSEIS